MTAKAIGRAPSRRCCWRIAGMRKEAANAMDDGTTTPDVLVYYPSRALNDRSEFKRIQYSDHTGSTSRPIIAYGDTESPRQDHGMGLVQRKKPPFVPQPKLLPELAYNHDVRFVGDCLREQHTLAVRRN